MRGYLLIVTSGILFFIIAVVTALHLMSAKALNQQYRLHDSYQGVLDRLSIQGFVSYFVDQNIEFIQLPLDLSSQYSLTNQIKADGSVDFSIEHNETGRVSTFNVVKLQTQSSSSSFDPLGVSVSDLTVSGVHVTSSIQTHLVSLRTVWYPYNSMDVLTHYSFVDANGDEDFVTANALMGEEYELNSPHSSNDRMMNLYFSSLSDGGVISIYLKYSDGSIQNAHIEY